MQSEDDATAKTPALGLVRCMAGGSPLAFLLALLLSFTFAPIPLPRQPCVSRTMLLISRGREQFERLALPEPSTPEAYSL